VGLVAFSVRRYFPTESARISVVNYRGQTAPDFSLKTSYGGSFKLSSLRNKAGLLTFYGNTCAPCRAETPWLVDFQNRYKDKGLEIVGVEMYGSSPNRSEHLPPSSVSLSVACWLRYSRRYL